MDKSSFELTSKYDKSKEDNKFGQSENVKNLPREPSGLTSSFDEHRRAQSENLKNIDADDADDEGPVQLTSNYEYGKQDDYAFGGLSLLYFLMNSGFSAFLPFLSIVLYRDGFEFWEIGILFSAAFFTSCLFSFMWDFLARIYNNNKQNLMVVSLLVWTGFLVPIFLVKVIPSKDPCVNIQIKNYSALPTILSNQENASIIQIIAQSNITDITVTGKHNGLTGTHISTHHLGLIISLFVVARLLQSPTDYFYFDHVYLIKLKTVNGKNGKTEYHISTKVISGFITILVGFALDRVLYCDPVFGGYQISFYVFVVFLAFATFVSYFLDVDSNDTHCSETRIIKRNNAPSKDGGFFKTLLKFITQLSLTISGISKSLGYTFTPIRLYKIKCSYTQIAIIFAAYKLSESLLKLYRRKLKCCHFEIVQLLFATQCIEGIKLILYSIISSNNFVWLLIPLEILSGVSGLLSIHDDVIQKSLPDDVLIRSSVKSIFILYWCVGFSFGPAAYGFSSHFYTTTLTFQNLGITNIVSSSVLMIMYAFVKYQHRVEKSKRNVNKSATSHGDEQSEDGDGFLYRNEFN